MKACVIGGGIIGCAVAWELRKRAFDVTVVERLGEVGHGSTSASCGIVRRFYSHVEMIALAQEGALIWQDWNRYVGPIDDDTATLVQSGMLFIPPRVDETTRATVASMQRIGVDVSLLSAAELAERFDYLDGMSHFPPKQPHDPDFTSHGGRPLEGAIWEADAGYVISPDLATHNLRRAAERDGVVFKMRHRVQAIRSERRPFGIVTDRDTVHADVVVNAAGPHSSQINAMADVTLPLATRALRREVHLMPHPVPDRDIPTIADIDSGIYFRPEGRRHALMVGTTDPEGDALQWVSDPDDYDDAPTEPCRERQCYRAMKRLPALRYGSRKGIAALYDVTLPDWYPIMDCTDLPGYYVAVGTSGSSFKTAPVLGSLMALLVESGESGRDLDRDPVTLPLPRTGQTLSSAFLSRNRQPHLARGTVLG